MKRRSSGSRTRIGAPKGAGRLRELPDEFTLDTGEGGALVSGFPHSPGSKRTFAHPRRAGVCVSVACVA